MPSAKPCLLLTAAAPPISWLSDIQCPTLRWSDFGLAVDLSEGGSRLRRPRVGSPDEEVRKQLVGWWYDTQKQVGRLPGELCSAMPQGICRCVRLAIRLT